MFRVGSHNWLSILLALCAGGLSGAGEPVTGTPRAGYGPLISDPGGLFDLPQGFTYTVVSQFGETMDDGFRVAGEMDGMAAFPGPQGRTILVRSHELDSSQLALSPYGSSGQLIGNVPVHKFYDPGTGGRPGLGCTTTILYDTATQQRLGQWLSNAGWVRTCAGSASPWGTWLTCEEDVSNPGSGYARRHGYAFEVPASSWMTIQGPMPRPALGRFRHEGLAVDPRTGIVYQTEDQSDSLIYRFIPDQRGNLTSGRLQALKVQGHPKADLRNWTSGSQYPQDTVLDVEWIDLTNVDGASDDLRSRGYAAGAARFARGEGMCFGKGSVFFTCTTGGIAQTGHVWRYTPSPDEGQPGQSPGKLQLFAEPNDAALMDHCDNITMAPWGDLIFCEDGTGSEYIGGITPARQYYRLGRNAANSSELAGAVFSPDQSTLFVNIYSDGVTLAIRGPWIVSTEQSVVNFVTGAGPGPGGLNLNSDDRVDAADALMAAKAP